MLHIKLKPGQRITIGDDVFIDVVLDARRKLVLRFAGPRDRHIKWIEPEDPAATAPLPENPNM